MAVIHNAQVTAIQRYDNTVAYGTSFGTFPNWPQSRGDRLIQVTAEAGSTVQGCVMVTFGIGSWNVTSTQCVYNLQKLNYVDRLLTERRKQQKF